MKCSEQPSFAIQPHCRHSFATGVLRLFWAVIVFTGELGVFLWTAVGCKWPSIDYTLDYEQPNVPTTHVLLVADTQVQHSALVSRNGWWASPVQRILFELNLRKNWYVTSGLKPDAVIFMGDMITNGKAAATFGEYDAAVQKFKSMFSVEPGTSVYYVPGNNDVGLGLKPATSQMLRSHYTKSFGPLNQKFVIQNHTFIAVDSPGLIDEDYMRNGRGVPFEGWAPLPDGTVSFVKQVARDRPDPMVLLTHVPLSRSESARCGPLRERDTIHRGAGLGWQAMISKQSSNFLLRSLQPLIVFSADNRDYCDHTHVLPYVRPSSSAFKRRERIREVTLKSFSLSAHIRRPGFQLVTLVDPDYLPNQLPSPDVPTPQSLTEGTCLLPDQYGIYTSFYLPLFVFTLLVLMWLNYKPQRPSRFKNKLGLTFRRSASAESGSSSSGPSTPSYLGFANINDVTPWSPFIPFSSVTPAVSPRSRMALSPNASSTYLGSTSPSSISSTTMLLGDGENGECRRGYFEEEDDDTIYPPPFYSDLSRSDSFGSVAPLGWGVQQQFSGSHGHVRHHFDTDLEMLDDKQQPDALMTFDEAFFAGSLPSHEFKQSDSEKPCPPQWSKSYTFVFHGRRRRIRLGLPSQCTIKNFIEFFAFGSRQRLSGIGRRRRNWLSALVIDVIGVFWVAVLAWVVINGIFLLQLA